MARSFLRTVTITGADDAVDPNHLLEISRDFPYAEWGILRSGNREGTPRYPTQVWRKRLRNCIVEDDRTQVPLSMHLCGQLARETMAGSGEHLDSEYRRVQLNGWSRYDLPMLLVANRYPQHEFIAQVQDTAAYARTCKFVTDLEYDNISVLWDPSGGRGARSTRFPSPFRSERVSYAGGIDSSNVQSTLEQLAWFGFGFGIDMESGVRTDDRFDLDKVRAVLELCRPYVQEKPVCT